MTNQPLFSIITICYNSEKTISDTIESVLNQTCKDYEYIIIDGKSTDKTLEIIESYRPQFQNNLTVVSEPDDGIYNAMNKGIRLAKGKYIGIINSDDWYESTTLEDVEKHTGQDYSIIYGLLKVWEESEPLRIEGFYPALLGQECLSHPTCFIRKKLYEEYGQYDERFKSAADLDLLLRFKEKNVSMYLVEKVLAHFRIGGTSSTLQGQIEAVDILTSYKFYSKNKSLYHKILIYVNNFKNTVKKLVK